MFIRVKKWGWRGTEFGDSLFHKGMLAHGKQQSLLSRLLEHSFSTIFHNN